MTPSCGLLARRSRRRAMALTCWCPQSVQPECALPGGCWGAVRAEEETPNDDAHMVSDVDEDDDDSVVQVVTKKVAKKGHAFASGFGTHDQRDAGEPTAHEKENPNDGVDMASDSDDVDDDSLEQDASKDNGFDGFGTPDPFNQNSDDQVDAEETYAPNQEVSNDDANMVSDEDENDYVSLVQPLSQTNST